MKQEKTTISHKKRFSCVLFFYLPVTCIKFAKKQYERTYIYMNYEISWYIYNIRIRFRIL